MLSTFYQRYQFTLQKSRTALSLIPSRKAFPSPHQHLAEIDQACNKRMEIIVSAMAKQENVTEALKATAQMEWVRRMNSIRNRAEEIVLTELVYE